MDIAVERGAVRENPVVTKHQRKRLKKKVGKKKLTLPSTSETQRLFSAIESASKVGGGGLEIADFCRFLAFSGCRRGEVATITGRP